MPSFDATTPQSQVVKNLVEAYFALDLKIVESFISKDFKFFSFPAMPEYPNEGKEGHFARYAPLLSMLTKMEITEYYEVIEAPGKVILHGSGAMHTSDGHEHKKDGVLIFTVVEEDGEHKISEIKEFIDPEQRSKIFSWANNALAKGGSAA